jgi:hypothetical protein
MWHLIPQKLRDDDTEIGRSPAFSAVGCDFANCQSVVANQTLWSGTIVFILVTGFFIRAIGAYLFHGIIDTEGAEYARIAENLLSGVGYVGIATPGTQLFFPPLFPLLIAAGSLITADIESGGLLVSILAGTSLIWSSYLLARFLYGPGTGHTAAALVAFHPLLVGWSMTLYCEITYLGLAMPGLYFGLRAIRDQRMYLFAIAGCFFGTAYLIRPEAIFYPILLVGAALIGALLADRASTMRIIIRSLGVLAGFLPIALPYIVWLSVSTGEVRIEGKSPVNIAIGERMLSGMTTYQALFEVDDQLIARGIALQPNLSIIQSAKHNPISLLPYLKSKFLSTIWNITRTTGGSLRLGAPVLSILMLLGLVRTLWSRQTIAAELMLFGVIAISLLALPFIYYESIRFFITFLFIALIWAAKGITELSDWIMSATSAYFPRQPSWSRFMRRGTISSSMAVLFLTSLIGVKNLPELRSFDYSSQPLKTAGRWIQNQHFSSITIADTWTPLAFHAHATIVWLPYTSSAVALWYIADRHVDFIVVSDREADSTPYLKDWAQNGIPDHRAHLIYYFFTPRLGGTAIYRWMHEGNSER